MARPTWPVGRKFIDGKARVFEVVHVIMGDPDAGVSFTVEYHNGWKITQQMGGDFSQTKAGFVQVGLQSSELIYETVDNLTKFLNQGYIKYK